MIQPLFLLSDWALLVARVVLGLILLSHGWPKLKNIKETAKSFDGMGFKPGIFWGQTVGLLEFAGGIALVLGFLTQVFGVLFILEFLIILVSVKKRISPKTDEVDWLILVIALILAAMGGGVLSLDGYFGLLLY